MKTEQFLDLLNQNNIFLTDQQMNQFQIYFETLVEWNEKMNLTAITEKSEVYAKHFFDSITPAFHVDFNEITTLCDVGAGAGFPSIPLKLFFPHLKITIVDSLKKRIGLLDHLADKVTDEHVEFYHECAETFGQNKEIRQHFDLVTARAVTKMTVLSELWLLLVNTKGRS